MRQLPGKKVLITGAGGSLGRELSIAFAKAGAEIVATDIQAAPLTETVRIVNSSGGRAIGMILDVTSASEVQQLRRDILQQVGPLDMVVNNAGTVAGGPFLDQEVGRHQSIFAVNAVGTMLVTHTFLPDLIRRPDAQLVMIISASGMMPVPLLASYTASKWAALGFAESIREELRLLGHRHVRVMAVCPSYIDTKLFQGVRTPWLMKALRPERVAHRVVRAVQRNRHQLLMPWPVKLIPLGRALLPLWLSERLWDWLGVSTSMSTWIGPQAEGDKAGRQVRMRLDAG